MRTTIVAFLALTGAVLHFASNWWEKAWATYAFSRMSPDGCIRVDTYDPYWVLPSLFHPVPHPDPEAPTRWGIPWEASVFRRAYEVSTGKLLGETIVYDPTVAFNIADWGDPRSIGRRVFTAGGFPFVDTDRCADEATLKRLGDFYKSKRERHERQDAARRSADAESHPL
jgi:hypothetical protein